MVGFHISMYAKIQSIYLNTVFAAWFTLHYMWFDWPKTCEKIIVKLLLNLFSPIYLCLTIFLTLIALIGYILNLIPVVRWLIELVVVCIWSFITVPLAILITAYDSQDYANKLTCFDQSHIF